MISISKTKKNHNTYSHNHNINFPDRQHKKKTEQNFYVFKIKNYFLIIIN